MNELQESLSKCKVEGNIVFLPSIADGPLTNYSQVRTALLKAGAKYKRNTFVFPNDAQPYMDKLLGGEVVNFKKETQSFFTPDKLADDVVALCGIEPGDCVLEPSAGQGSLIKAIYRAFPQTLQSTDKTDSTGIVTVDYCELNDVNRSVLEKVIDKSRTSFMGENFLEFSSYQYKRIVANPPFSKNQDIEHIKRMYELLLPGGTMVSIASKHWKFSDGKKEKHFRDWIERVVWNVIDVPAKQFQESGTNIETCIIVINK